MHTIYTGLKVNNEIEICEIADMGTKQQVEKILLQNRISYFIKWPKSKLFARRRVLCILCVNENSCEAAEVAIKSLGEEVTDGVRFIMRKSDNSFL
ncbi:MAG: hypothetical protein E7293_02025 [Lachnospiraceae bacterium]|nr:hypothetical protein [Lachnospiraceae bacterium]